MSAVACLLVVLFVAVGLAALAAAIRSAPARRERDAGDDDDGQGGGGGSQRRVPPGPPPEPSGVSPDWWPQFERELAAYARRNRRAPQGGETTAPA